MTDQRPAAEGLPPGHFPGPPVGAGHTAPCPRRLRARVGGAWVLDTTAASYVWEHPFYPQYAVPAVGLPAALIERSRRLPDDAGLDDHLVLPFDAADDWFEEDEPVHGHPRSPYVRVDALRSSRRVTVRLPGTDGRLVAATSAPVAVFETGLPPRWYLDPTAVDRSLLFPSDTSTLCPYKGRATDWWSADGLPDVAWSYGAPTSAVAAIAGLVAFDDTRLVVDVDP